MERQPKHRRPRSAARGLRRSWCVVCFVVHYFHAVSLHLAIILLLTKWRSRSGFEGKTLIEGTQDPSIKKQLIENTERAVRNGLCGAPSFQVDGGEVVWGQDRFEVVEDMLCGWVSKDADPPMKARL